MPTDVAVVAAACQASIGVHSMRNEHFGISVVELMAAGAVVVAHDSGGPQMDIIRVGSTGFLADSPSDYAERMAHIVRMPESQLQHMRALARQDVLRFSDLSFRQQMFTLLKDFLVTSSNS